MGKRNKAIKLTKRKIRYIIRNKINNNSTKRIASEMKVSISTAKRVWMYWLKNREALPLNKSGRKKKELDKDTRSQIIEIHKEQKLGARRLERSWNSNIISMSHTVRYHEARIQALPTDSR